MPAAVRKRVVSRPRADIVRPAVIRARAVRAVPSLRWLPLMCFAIGYKAIRLAFVAGEIASTFLARPSPRDAGHFPQSAAASAAQ
jgi:hypothetical protein